MAAHLTDPDVPLPGVSATAQWTAAARARESRRPDRLFHDPYAQLLAGPVGMTLLTRFHTTHAAADGNPVLAIRTRWFDDFLRACASPGAQVVALGAGLDTRAFRLEWPPGTVLYEVDQPELLDYKASRLATLDTVPRCVRRPVPVDLADARWTVSLAQAGHDPTRPSVWFAEGLLFYLPQAQATQLLADAAGCSAPGSRLAADLIGTGVFRLRYMRPLLHALGQAGSPWCFGTDAPGRFMAECGWRADRIVEPGDPDANYGRWPVPAAVVAPDNLPRSFLVAASPAASPAAASPVTQGPARCMPS